MENSYRYREYLVSLIRSGVVRLQNVIISPPTFNQNIAAYQVYLDSYEEARKDGIMSHEELEKFYNEHKVFIKDFDHAIKSFEDNISDLKESLFKNYKDKNFVKNKKAELSHKKKLLNKVVNKKNSLYVNTCENIAEAKRMSWIINETSDVISSNYSVLDNIDNILDEYNKFLLDESKIRDLCKNEPWKSLWSVSQKGGVKLFITQEDQDLTFNQRNLLSWSHVYDNIQESMECPDQEVIDDDDILDGWFINQNKKRASEKNANELTKDMSPSMRKHQNQFRVISNEFSKEDIISANSEQSKHIMNERRDYMKEKGSSITSASEFPDVQRNIDKQLAEKNKQRKK